MKVAITLLAILVLVSGCVDLGSVFGSNALSIQQSTVENGVHDVITVKDIQTIPNSPMLPSQPFVFSFVLQNNDKLQTATAKVDLFNAPTIKSEQGNPCNLYVSSASGAPCPGIINVVNQPGSENTLPSTQYTGYVQSCATYRYCTPDKCGLSGCQILPGEEKPVTYTLLTPSQDDIKNIKTDTELDFKTTYDFSGSLSYLLPAVNMQEILNRQRTGQKTNLFTTKSYGSGPIQIDSSIQGAPYMLGDYDTVLFFTINNKGSGTLVDSEIKQYDPVSKKGLTITFPQGITFPTGADGRYDITKFSSDIFSCNSNGEQITCVNDKAVIPLYKDQSRTSLRFTVRLAEPLQEPFRSFQITADVGYSYELRNSMQLTVNPFQNV